jgi:hypothetical protein
MIQPPIHVSGNPNIDWIIFGVGLVFALYWLRALRLARQGVRLLIRNAAKAVIVFAVCAIAIPTAFHIQAAQSQFFAFFIAFCFFLRWQNTKRSRYVPASTKRAVIARDLKGEKYDPTKHHIDHVWPFARGGSHTADNLRVIEKRKNLQKGAKRPGIRDMW